MKKDLAVASVTQEAAKGLLAPVRQKAALRANDRLKLLLTILQAAAGHARHPGHMPVDLSRETAAAQFDTRDDTLWLSELPTTAFLQDDDVVIPGLPRLAHRLSEELGTMFQPLDAAGDALLGARVRRWRDHLDAIQSDRLTESDLASLTSGRRGEQDTLHLVVMDVHKELNHLSSKLATRTLDGASVWQLAEDGSDDPRVSAFMRGVNATRALKLDHPGLETAATRDGTQLLIQNDIGTNDAHVIVIQVDTGKEHARVTLTYSDLHRHRFLFFQRQLGELGAQWSAPMTQASAHLNAGQSYHLGTASFDAPEEPALLDVLEAIGSRIVFLIDWNRARKRLLPFVGRDCAVAVLQEAARQRVGHMAWLQAGGESLIWNAMADQQPGSFRLGDRLDRVVGDGVARDFLIEALTLSCRGLERGHSVSLIADEVRALLARKMQGRRAELQLLEEHAALCHALAQGVRDALGLDMHRDFAAAERLAGRAKAWEHQADALVVNARSQAQQQPRFQPLARLVECSDDVADALEESCFVLATLAQHLEASHKGKPWPREVHEALSSLSETVLGAVQDHVKALAIAGSMDEGSDAGDHAAFLSACWQVVHAERRCDELLRAIRRSLAAAYRSNSDAVAYLLGSDFAMALEQASDALLVLSHGLRQRVLQHLQSPGG